MFTWLMGFLIIGGPFFSWLWFHLNYDPSVNFGDFTTPVVSRIIWIVFWISAIFLGIGKVL